MKTIAIIGGGNMGEALIKGLTGHRLCVVEANPSRAAYIKRTYNVTLTGIGDVVAQAEIVMFAVKPQDMGSALREVGEAGRRLYISIAAGLTTRFFEKGLGGKARVVRCMPNMPGLIGEGITGICKGQYATAADLRTADGVLQSIGQTIVVKESLMDAVTAVSGSGPAYVFLFVEQWMAAARAMGFSEQQAQTLVYKTLLGSAKLLQGSRLSAAELRAKVTSKGGTTQVAMDVFARRKFDQLMKEALIAACKRSKELAR